MEYVMAKALKLHKKRKIEDGLLPDLSLGQEYIKFFRENVWRSIRLVQMALRKSSLTTM